MGRSRVVLSPAARVDIREILVWSRSQFGRRAAIRYQELFAQALRDIAVDPEKPGSILRPEFGGAIRTWHLSLSRLRAETSYGVVGKPRHVLVYRLRNAQTVDILRVLHDSRDVIRHLPPDVP